MVEHDSRRGRRPANRSAGEGGKKGVALTTADLIVLSLLCEKPMHGYELIREYERQEVRDWASVSRPHVYYALKKLASTGHIVGSETRDGARRRSVYKVTSTGSAALADALADPAWAMSQVPSPFTTWLGLSIHARPADARSVVEVRRAFLADQIRKERKTLAAVAADDG